VGYCVMDSSLIELQDRFADLNLMIDDK